MRAVIAVACALVVGVAPAGCKRGKDRRTGDTKDDAGVRSAGAAGNDAQVDSRPFRIVLTNASIKTVEPKEPRDIHVRELTEAVASMLTRSGQFAHGRDAVPPDMRPRSASLEMVITYEIVSEAGKPPLIAVAVESELEWDESSEDLIPSQNIFADRPLSRAERAPRTKTDELVAAFVADTVWRAAQALIAKEAIRTGAPGVVVDAVKSSDPELVRWALDVVRERKLTEAFDAVAPLLGSDDRDLRGRAVGALVGIGDPRAVDAMANAVEFTDHDMLEMVIEAVTAFGGEDARVYLDFVASGHPDQKIRQRATEALARVK